MPGISTLAATAVLYAFLWRLARIDMATRRLPDRLTVPLVVLGLCWSSWSRGDVPWPALIGAAAGYAAFATLGWSWFRIRGVEGLGLGDAKLFAAGGAWLGWQALPWIALAASCGALGAAIVSGRRAEPIAFGPWLAVAIALLWAFGEIGF